MYSKNGFDFVIFLYLWFWIFATGKFAKLYTISNWNATLNLRLICTYTDLCAWLYFVIFFFESYACMLKLMQ